MTQENIQADEATQEVDAVDAEEVTQTEPQQEVKPDIETKAVAQAPSNPIQVKDGLLAPTDARQLASMADSFLASKALPKQFINRAQVVMALQYARQIGFGGKELAALRQMTIINGTLSIWGELPKALALATGEVEMFEESILDKDYKAICPQNKNLDAAPWVAICQGKRKGQKEAIKYFTMEQAKTAGLLDKTGSLYKIYPHRMLQMRARSLFLKDEFPDALSGISILEYDHDAIVNAQGVIEKAASEFKNVAEELNTRLLAQTVENATA